MKKIGILFIMAMFVVSAMPIKGYASDYQGKEKEDSIFQKLSDLIKGKYDVGGGKTLKEKGVIQVTADQIKDIKPAPVR